MQFRKFLYFPTETWTIICNFWNFFLFCKNMDYHMQFIEFLSLLYKRELLSYAISEISFSFPKTWTIICNLWNFFPFYKNVDYLMQFQKYLSRLSKRGLSYAITGIYFFSLKTWTIICCF